jgi:hypothetical protein
LSVYSDSIATPAEIGQQIAKLKVSFPSMKDSFFNVLAERIVANRFTGKRLKDAVNSIIDNFQYKELNVSDVIRFDKRVKFYSYNDVCTLVTKGKADFSDFEVKEKDGKHFRVKKTDLM